MADVIISVQASQGTPPYEYRVDGGAWQSSNIFNLPAATDAVSYTFEVRDADNCISEYVISEPKLEIMSIGGFVSSQLDVHGGIVTNTPVQVQMDWGTGAGYPYDPDDFAGRVGWNSTFKEVHDTIFPIAFVGSYHFFRYHLRTPFGQTLVSDIKGILWVPSEVDVDNSIYSAIGSILTKNKTDINVTQGGRIFTQHQTGPDGNPQLTLTVSVDSITSQTPDVITANHTNRIFIEHSYTIT